MLKHLQNSRNVNSNNVSIPTVEAAVVTEVVGDKVDAGKEVEG